MKTRGRVRAPRGAASLAQASLAQASLVQAALALIALAMASACGKTDDATPRDVAMQFYVTLEVSGIRELPEPRAGLALTPYLTDSLRAALEAARVYRDGRAASAPGEKPPFTDGNIFSSLFEGYTTYRVADTLTRGDSAFVTMALTNTEQKPAVNWTDTLVLLAQSPPPRRSWRVADLRYGGNWEFGYRGSLAQVLRQR